MRYILCLLASFAWALWLGGLVVLFLAVTTLFDTFPDRSVAGLGATNIFKVFERYQLILAAVGLLSIFFLRWRYPGKGQAALFALVAAATVAAVVSAAFITPAMDRLRLGHLTHEAQFMRLHGLSMILFTLETAFLTAAGFVLPFLWRRPLVEAVAADSMNQKNADER